MAVRGQAQPASQLRHAVVPGSFWYSPVGHGVGAVIAVLGQVWPTGHCRHCDALVIFMSAEYVPTGQAFSNPLPVPAGQ